MLITHDNNHDNKGHLEELISVALDQGGVHVTLPAQKEKIPVLFCAKFESFKKIH